MLMDVMDYLQNPPEEEGGEEGADQGQEGAEGEDLPYPGQEGLQELWKEVTELCNEEDIDRLEEELKGKTGEEQWNTLLDVREYLLNGDEEEQQAFADWQPTGPELDTEWKQMLKRVPKEEVKEVQVRSRSLMDHADHPPMRPCAPCVSLARAHCSPPSPLTLTAATTPSIYPYLSPLPTRT